MTNATKLIAGLLITVSVLSSARPYAANLKRRRPKLCDKWFLDEVFLKINGVQHYLWSLITHAR